MLRRTPQSKDGNSRPDWRARMRAPFTSRRGLTNDNGAAALEFALVGPFFLALLLAVFEFGRLFLYQASLQYAVEEAGRFAVAEYTRSVWVDGDTEAAAMAAVELTAETNIANNIIGWNPASVVFEVAPDPSSPNFLDFTGTVTFRFLVPWIPIPDIVLTASTRLPLIA